MYGLYEVHGLYTNRNTGIPLHATHTRTPRMAALTRRARNLTRMLRAVMRDFFVLLLIATGGALRFYDDAAGARVAIEQTLCATPHYARAAPTRARITSTLTQHA